MKIHFMGIGGSGMSAVAALAKASGFVVDGCDKSINSPYTEKLRKDINIQEGHSTAHLEGKDLLVVTPAVYFDDPKPDEFLAAGNKMTWQKFMGKYLQKGNEVICVAGTHGKSTTTAMLSLVFEKAGIDPSVMVGAKVKQWGANYRVGKSGKFIVESDEFYDSFLNYSPNAIILNNIEFDHPDYFKTKKQLINSFRNHLKSLKGKKILIVNKDSKDAYKLAKSIPGVNLFTYSIYDSNADLYGEIVRRTQKQTEFKVVCKRLKIEEYFKLKILGDYNISNALGVIALSLLYSIEVGTIKRFFNNFYGIGRRMELIGESNGIKIYDDYAHHPTAIRVTLEGLRQKYPNSRITAVVEPHSFSRTKKLLSSYKDVFKDADRVIIAPIFQARDSSTFGIDGKSLVSVSNHKNISYIDSFDEIVKNLKKELRAGDVAIVMGAGKSYEIAKKLLA